MEKTCTQCSAKFTVTESEVALYKKLDQQPIDICFTCHCQHLLTFRNERTLYQRKCDATGETIVSLYSPDKPYKVYKHDYWSSDKWDAMDYGQHMDFNRPFFEQLKELQLAVPRVGLFNINGENSDYCNLTTDNKNCYLVFGGDFNQECMYGTLCMGNSDSFDIDFTDKSELCYMTDNSMSCYGSQFVWDSKSCTDCAFIVDCIGCSDCLFSYGLKNKQYCIENKQYSKEEYFKKKAEILNGSYEQQQKNWEKFKKMKAERVVKYVHTMGAENCTGDYIRNSKNCHNCYDITDGEDCANGIMIAGIKDSLNSCYTGHKGTELAYMCVACMGNVNIQFCYGIMESSDVEYSDTIISSQSIFGCVGLKRKEYCILNKQYSKEDYQELRAKIIEHMKKTGEWGKLFPKDFSPFAYNESTSYRYWPFTKEEALSKGFRWKEPDKKSYQPQTAKVPDNIQDVQEAITQEILACQTCGKNFKILPKELEFYKKQNIPIPRACPDCRHYTRFSLRNPYKLYSRECINCQKPVETTYPPQSPETIYCEACYLKEVY